MATASGAGDHDGRVEGASGSVGRSVDPGDDRAPLWWLRDCQFSPRVSPGQT